MTYAERLAQLQARRDDLTRELLQVDRDMDTTRALEHTSKLSSEVLTQLIRLARQPFPYHVAREAGFVLTPEGERDLHAVKVLIQNLPPLIVSAVETDAAGRVTFRGPGDPMALAGRYKVDRSISLDDIERAIEEGAVEGETRMVDVRVVVP